ncbi:MAG: cell division protein FtsQ/DivIB [Thermodesulfobacteriota bacterium]
MGSILGVCTLLLFLAFLSWGLLEGYTWLTTTSYFAIEKIQIKGNNRLEKKEILNKIGLHKGQNALKISIGNIESKLKQIPWIKEVSVKRKLPHSIHVGIKEKKPVFWTRKQKTVFYANKIGGVIAPVTAEDLVSLPLLYTENKNKGLKKDLKELTGQLQQKELPFSMANISWVNFVSGELVEFFLRDFEILIRLGRDRIAGNCRFLGKIWKDLNKREELQGVKTIRVYKNKGWVGFDRQRLAANF